MGAVCSSHTPQQVVQPTTTSSHTASGQAKPEAKSYSSQQVTTTVESDDTMDKSSQPHAYASLRDDPDWLGPVCSNTLNLSIVVLGASGDLAKKVRDGKGFISRITRLPASKVLTREFFTARRKLILRYSNCTASRYQACTRGFCMKSGMLHLSNYAASVFFSIVYWNWHIHSITAGQPVLLRHRPPAALTLS